MRTFLLFLAVCLTASFASAAFVGYDPQGSEQPDAYDSDWVQSSHSESCLVSPWGNVTDGIAYWSLASGRSSWTNDADFDSSTTWTMDIKCKTVTSSSGWQYQMFIQVRDGDERIICSIGDNKDPGMTGVKIIAEDGGAPGTYGEWYGNCTDEGFNIWRFVRDGAMMYVYLNDNATPVISHATATANLAGGLSQVNIGRIGGRAAGKAYFDYILWDDSQAILAPPVPEPATLTLLALGGGLLLRRKK